MKAFYNTRTKEYAREMAPPHKYYMVSRSEVIPPRLVENSNDWKKVECWEITEVNSNSQILAVRRNRDDAQFKIGDTVKVWDSIKKIEAIYFSAENEDPLFFKMEGQHNCTETNPWQGYKLDALECKRNHKTVDGITVSEGSTVYVIPKILKSQNLEFLAAHFPKQITFTTEAAFADFLVFKNDSTAKQHLLLNLPLFSIKDIQKVYVSANGNYRKNGTGINYFEELIKMAKNKLKS